MVPRFFNLSRILTRKSFEGSCPKFVQNDPNGSQAGMSGWKKKVKNHLKDRKTKHQFFDVIFPFFPKFLALCGRPKFLSSILRGGTAILGLQTLIFLCILLVCKRQVVCIGVEISRAQNGRVPRVCILRVVCILGLWILRWLDFHLKPAASAYARLDLSPTAADNRAAQHAQS